MGFAHGLGHPPSFASFTECKGAFSEGNLQTSAPEALFVGTSASTAPPTWLGSTVSKQRSSPRPNVKGTGPAADCCVSGPLFFDYSFLCDSEDEELAGTVECCHSSLKGSRTSRMPRSPLPAFVGKSAPTRKARTHLWRTRVAKSNNNFWVNLRKGTGRPRPAPEEPGSTNLEGGSLPGSARAQAPPPVKGATRRRR